MEEPSPVKHGEPETELRMLWRGLKRNIYHRVSASLCQKSASDNPCIIISSLGWVFQELSGPWTGIFRDGTQLGPCSLRRLEMSKESAIPSIERRLKQSCNMFVNATHSPDSDKYFKWFPEKWSDMLEWWNVWTLGRVKAEGGEQGGSKEENTYPDSRERRGAATWNLFHEEEKWDQIQVGD